MKITFSVLVGSLAGVAAALKCSIKTRNFIYIVPDGYGVASQVLARDYVALLNGNGTLEHPNSPQLGADPLVRLSAFF